MIAKFKTACGAERIVRDLSDYPPLLVYRVPLYKTIRAGDPTPDPSSRCATTRDFRLISYNQEAAVYEEIVDPRLFK